MTLCIMPWGKKLQGRLNRYNQCGWDKRKLEHDVRFVKQIQCTKYHWMVPYTAWFQKDDFFFMLYFVQYILPSLTILRWHVNHLKNVLINWLMAQIIKIICSLHNLKQTNQKHTVIEIEFSSYKRLYRRSPLSAYLWIPEHSMHKVIPRLILAQRGSGRPQSQHFVLPGIHCTFCRALSPLTSFVSVTGLVLDMEGFLSVFWNNKKFISLQYAHILELLKLWKLNKPLLTSMQINMSEVNLCILVQGPWLKVLKPQWQPGK